MRASTSLDISIDGARGVLFAISGGEDLSMMEIQEAAHIITESADPEAKVIFGAIRDDRLKKGQIKITVIASGFGGPNATPKKRGLFSMGSVGEATAKQESKPPSSVQPLASSIQHPSDMGVLMNRPPTPHAKKEKEKEEEEDDSWAMPAFLRRKK